MEPTQHIPAQLPEDEDSLLAARIKRVIELAIIPYTKLMEARKTRVLPVLFELMNQRDALRRLAEEVKTHKVFKTDANKAERLAIRQLIRQNTTDPFTELVYVLDNIVKMHDQYHQQYGDSAWYAVAYYGLITQTADYLDDLATALHVKQV